MFGSWHEALVAAGLEKTNTITVAQKSLSKDEAATILKEAIREDYKLIFFTNYLKSGKKPSAHALSYPFYNWRAAMKYLSIDIDRKGLLGKTNFKFAIAKIVVSEAIEKWDKEL
ncbi:hypothetical protein RB620_24570 [Paenibacillus sp. LHD-117]|uniref:hypothetical protein n=1 Tax=Paenibacillus sp. LHD-117 TaxID=3071412 RepID=UPI0027E045EA|nr:hypothetical protein [Paenibacillus sp. LHD-117]MDQ6422611.1 hypothetical protein [Paenibacillus sp. LHD-117]